MKVGIDARNLITRQSGIGRYLVQTTRNLIGQGCEVTLYLPEAPHVDFAAIEGARLVVSNHRGAFARSLWSQTTLPRAAASDRINVFWGPAHRLPVHLPDSIPKVLTVLDLVWIHAPMTMRLRTWTGERVFMGAAVRVADAIVAISEATATDVRRRYRLPRDRISTIYPGATPIVMSDDPGIRTRHGLDGAYALFVGTLEPRKNLKMLIEAYASLDQSLRTRCKLAIAGGRGWRMQDLDDLVTACGLDRDVVLIDYPNQADLGHLYAHARFVAMPSIFEGFGLPIVEANAFGVPVLTSNVSSMPEVAGAAGLLVDPYSKSSIARGFRTLVEDEALHAELANAARSNAARFDWAQSTRKLIAVFERVIAARRGARTDR